MKKYHIQFICKTNEHKQQSQVSPITTIIRNPYAYTNLNNIKQNQTIITIGHDNHIKIWKNKTLQVLQSYLICSPYLTSIISFSQQKTQQQSIGKHKQVFLLGIGDGTLMFLTSQLQVYKQLKLHEDCISGIVLHSDWIITVSYDGHVKFINKKQLSIQKQFNVNMPIQQCLIYRNQLYLASYPAYKLNLQTYKLTQLRKYNQFIVHDDRLFGRHDQIGIECLNTKTAIKLPCQFIMSAGSAILFTANTSIGLLYFNQDIGQLQYSWKLSMFQQIPKGFAFKSGIYQQQDGPVLLVGESSQIYKFKITCIDQKHQQIQKCHKNMQ